MKIETTLWWSILRKWHWRALGYLYPDYIRFMWGAWYFEIEKPANKACTGLWLLVRKISLALGFRQSQ